MDILINMRAFVSVAESGSLTCAAQRLVLTTAHVSRAVANLEGPLE
ncbi:helix-turn-helix domain-containing protein, partial [Pseudomonas aeruginosa]